MAKILIELVLLPYKFLSYLNSQSNYFQLIYHLQASIVTSNYNIQIMKFRKRLELLQNSKNRIEERFSFSEDYSWDFQKQLDKLWKTQQNSLSPSTLPQALQSIRKLESEIVQDRLRYYEQAQNKLVDLFLEEEGCGTLYCHFIQIMGLKENQFFRNPYLGVQYLKMIFSSRIGLAVKENFYCIMGLRPFFPITANLSLIEEEKSPSFSTPYSFCPKQPTKLPLQQHARRSKTPPKPHKLSRSLHSHIPTEPCLSVPSSPNHSLPKSQKLKKIPYKTVQTLEQKIKQNILTMNKSASNKINKKVETIVGKNEEISFMVQVSLPKSQYQQKIRLLINRFDSQFVAYFDLQYYPTNSNLKNSTLSFVLKHYVIWIEPQGEFREFILNQLVFLLQHKITIALEPFDNIKIEEGSILGYRKRK